MTVEGLVLDLTNGFGVSGIWDGSEGVLATIANNSRDYQDLYLNGISFGSGRVESIDFDPGVDVRTKGYRANIIVFNSGNLFNFTGFYYSGIDTSNFQYLDSFSETYAFDHKQNGGYNYSHNAAITFTSGVGQLNAIDAAKSVARTLFTGSNLGMAFYSGYTNKQGKRIYTEGYNLISNACSFQETFDFDSDQGNYSVLRTNSFQLDENGIINVTEEGNLKGIENPNYQKALSAVGIEMAGSYIRCSGVAAFYYPSGVPLLTTPIVNGRTLDIFSNNVAYTVTFTNNPNNSGTYLWDYNQQISRQDGIATIVEDGKVIGRGPNRTSAFSAAQDGFMIVKASIPGRTTSLFISAIGSGTNYLEAKNESQSPYQGTVGYSYTYSNDPNLVASAGIRKINVTEELNSSVYEYNRIDIFNFKEIIQNNYQSTIGSDLLKISMEGDKTVDLPTFLATGLSIINSRLPVGNDRYVGECSYSYQLNSNLVDISLTWLFNTAASQIISL